MTYYYDLGVDGLFTDFADTGVEARDASINASNVSANNQFDILHRPEGRGLPSAAFHARKGEF